MIRISEGTERLDQVISRAEYVWDDCEKAREWLSKAHRELDGSTPFEEAQTEVGACRVDELLDKLFYGLPV